MRSELHDGFVPRHHFVQEVMDGTEREEVNDNRADVPTI